MAMEGTSRGSFLLKQSREIAEARDELVRLEQQLTTTQARNATLLEESSELDSEISWQSGQAALAEQRLATLEEEARRVHDTLAKQKASHAVSVAALSSENASRREVLERAEVNARSHHARSAELEEELARYRKLLEEEEAKVNALLQAGKEWRATVPAFVEQAEQKFESELQVLTEQREEELGAANAVRLRLSAVEAELSAERLRRDDFGRSLRKAVAEQSGDAVRIRALEVTVESLGGNPRVLLSEAAEDRDRTGGGERRGGRQARLREELQESKDQCAALVAAIQKAREQETEGSTQLHAELDEAREALQRNLKQAAQEHKAEVSRLEDEVQAERQRYSDEVFDEKAAAESLADLQSARLRLIEQTRTVGSATQAGLASLSRDMERVFVEVRAAEQLRAAAVQLAADAHQRRQAAIVDGEHRAAKVRGMIEEIWNNLRAVHPVDVR